MFLSISCSDDDSLSTDKEIIPGRNVYVAGYISDGSGNTIACYWHNGKRIELGSGEVSDIVAIDGKVYSVGYDFGGSASYWIDTESYQLEGNDPEAYSIAVHNGDVYTAGRDNGACYWKNTQKHNFHNIIASPSAATPSRGRSPSPPGAAPGGRGAPSWCTSPTRPTGSGSCR